MLEVRDGGGIVISRRQEIFSPSFEHLQIFPPSPLTGGQFFKFPKSRITGVVSADNFLDAPLGQTIYFSNFSHANNFFPIRILPEKNNGQSLN